MRQWRFWIDRGGTFTDFVACRPDGALLTHKRLSRGDAVIAGIRHLLGLAQDAPIPSDLIAHVKLGTTVATNALLERTGARTLLVVNTGFADILRIGTQARPRLFDLAITLPPMLFERVAEVSGRIAADGTELAPLDEAAATATIHAAIAAGMASCAIALLHAWRNPDHERRLAAIARAAGFAHVSVSHEACPTLRLVPRAHTTVADAYLSPVLARHTSHLAAALPGTTLLFMQNHGGLADASAFRGKDAILSGPAGGIVGAVRTAAAAGFDHVIGFDMGGTSTDVALYAGAYERTEEAEIAGVRVRTPMLAIHTVAAGGGSILHADPARFRVGPDSAGAEPGPASYGIGGPLTLTDANICLGRLQPAHVPAVFGPSGNAKLDAETVRRRFTNLANGGDPRPVAEGFFRIAVANMADAIRKISVRRGHDPARFVLNCFGGAGGQHACAVADELGIATVLIHPMAGVLSAYGMGLADQSVVREQAIERPLAPDTADLHALADRLAHDARSSLPHDADGPKPPQERRYARLRQQGADTTLSVPLTDAPNMQAAFAARHRHRFGFVSPVRSLVVEAVGVELLIPGEPIAAPIVAAAAEPPTPIDHATIFCVGHAHDAPIYDRATLSPGARIDGSALIVEPTSTTVLDPGWRATVAPDLTLLLRRATPRAATFMPAAGAPDPVLLELLGNAFMAVAEQSGEVLRETAHSVNIKERLDFSCALFDAAGQLIANAPHVPVHLGAMGDSVRCVLAARAGILKPGDVIALNNPARGGTHLPDITVITPGFDPSGATLRYFVAARGHHADIGGTTPGSTPANSKNLAEEGVVIDDFMLVEAGEFREAAFRALLAEGPYPARDPDTNVADIVAQIAANAAALRALAALTDRHSWPVVDAYLAHVLDHAEAQVRRVIGSLHDGSFDYRMDDGARLAVAVRVNHAARTAKIDFSGTDPQRHGNFNAPQAVTRAVVLYVLRCLIAEDIPLNDGCLRPITLIIPPGSFLAPEPTAAVVAGNTEVSQAVCAALLGALGAAASSQATMNNLLFGDQTVQYYETICGGAGAGENFAGASAVHTHMTNTRMTDPEVLELRLPVRLERFAIRRNSGGQGRHQGGDGVIRTIRFLRAMTLVLVSSRRTIAPFGLAGGADGAPGAQWIDRADGTREPIAGVATTQMRPGDAITIQTPGGGAYALFPPPLEGGILGGVTTHRCPTAPPPHASPPAIARPAPPPPHPAPPATRSATGRWRHPRSPGTCPAGCG